MDNKSIVDKLHRDEELLGQYLSHAKEITRLSILGIGIIGVLLFWNHYWHLHSFSVIGKVFLIISLFFFSIAAVFSLKQGFIVSYNIYNLKKYESQWKVEELIKQMDESGFKGEWLEMMKKSRLLFLNNTIHLGLGVLFFAFSIILFAIPPYPETNRSRQDDGKIMIDIVQLNDVYEIAPLEGGHIGGMGRIATLKKRCLEENPNTLMVMAGDFLSPSVFNNIKHNGVRVQGRQMIEAMNAAGFDIAVFGNHEFDLAENDLQQCIDASNFEWVASNVLQKTISVPMAFKQRSKPLQPYIIKTFTDADGTVARIGFIGLTIASNTNKGYVKYDSANVKAKEIYNQIRSSCDAVIALTHQSLDADKQLAQMVPGLAVIIGGHEHEGRMEVAHGIQITKAPANAKKAFVLHVTIDKNSGQGVKLLLTEQKLDETITADETTTAIVEKWMQIAKKELATSGFNPSDTILMKGLPLDGRDEAVRRGPTNLTKAITEAMLRAYVDAEVAIFNAGAIRVDELLHMPVTQYDIIRALPYIDSIKQVKMRGSTLKKIMHAEKTLPPGDGMFLQYSASFDKQASLIKGNSIVDDKTYIVVMANYLLTCNEEPFLFLQKETEVMPLPRTAGGDVADMNHALIAYIKSQPVMGR